MNDQILFNYSNSFELLFKLNISILNSILMTQLLNESNLTTETIKQIVLNNFEFLKNLINENLNNEINSNNIEIVYRNNTSEDKYSMKWHIDDKQLIKKNIQPVHSMEIIHQDEKHIYALYGNKNPKYSIILYLDSHNIDFKGGEFHFENEIILPQKGDILIFDSRLVHKVDLLTSGRRRAILIKLY
jgi:predicted 2-oxoglutarate/Fe(II)-dependent dioxygenase YbiX